MIERLSATTVLAWSALFVSIVASVVNAPGLFQKLGAGAMDFYAYTLIGLVLLHQITRGALTPVNRVDGVEWAWLLLSLYFLFHATMLKKLGYHAVDSHELAAVSGLSLLIFLRSAGCLFASKASRQNTTRSLYE